MLSISTTPPVSTVRNELVFSSAETDNSSDQRWFQRYSSAAPIPASYDEPPASLQPKPKLLAKTDRRTGFVPEDCANIGTANSTQSMSSALRIENSSLIG